MQDDFPAWALTIGRINAQVQRTTTRTLYRPTSIPRVTDHPRPPADGPSDQYLINQCRGGNQDAATQLYLRYQRRLTKLVRKQCSADLARCAGVEDIVQSVFGNFFRAVGQGCYDIHQGDTVWKLLLVIALNAVRTHATYHYAAKRDAHRTVTGEEAHEHLEMAANAREPAPPQFELVLQDILEMLPHRNRFLMRLLVDRCTVAEIARIRGCSIRTIDRHIQETRLLLNDLLREDD
jgi:RNA polymerase sigma-70 factor, ECF subfamily